MGGHNGFAYSSLCALLVPLGPLAKYGRLHALSLGITAICSRPFVLDHRFWNQCICTIRCCFARTISAIFWPSHKLRIGIHFGGDNRCVIVTSKSAKSVVCDAWRHIFPVRPMGERRLRSSLVRSRKRQHSSDFAVVAFNPCRCTFCALEMGSVLLVSWRDLFGNIRDAYDFQRGHAYSATTNWYRQSDYPFSSGNSDRHLRATCYIYVCTQAQNVAHRWLDVKGYLPAQGVSGFGGHNANASGLHTPRRRHSTLGQIKLLSG